MGKKRKKMEKGKKKRKQIRRNTGNNKKHQKTTGKRRGNERKREETRGNEFCPSHFYSNGTLLERVTESDFVVCCPFAPSDAGSWSARGGVSGTMCPMALCKRILMGPLGRRRGGLQHSVFQHPMSVFSRRRKSVKDRANRGLSRQSPSPTAALSTRSESCGIRGPGKRLVECQQYLGSKQESVWRWQAVVAVVAKQDRLQEECNSGGREIGGLRPLTSSGDGQQHWQNPTPRSVGRRAPQREGRSAIKTEPRRSEQGGWP